MIYVFVGPTLSATEGRSELDAVFLPPAAQGDVYRASLDRPEAIALVDGYFERVASVWHKEILWAMAQGIRVYGGASMGALRAAELSAFGMIGVGAIFESFQRGDLEDDDEVAVAHAPAADGYRPTSEAMVNIRGTLESAAAAGVVARDTGDALLRLAKGLFYPDRCYPTLLARGRAEALPKAELDALAAWLPAGRIDRKRLDALATLRKVKEHLAEDPAPFRVLYHFEHTDAWEEAVRVAGRASPASTQSAGEHAASTDAIVEELGVEGRFPERIRGAMARALAIETASRQGRSVQGATLETAVETFRQDRRLFQPDAFKRWLEEQHIEDPERFFTDEAQVQWIEAVFGAAARTALPDHLRSIGDYGRLATRAADKQRLLSARGLDGADLTDAGVTEEELLRWYFEERLRSPMPVDFADHASAAGFEDEASWRRAVLRELLYVRESAASGCPDGA